jgi:GNAT superfamily N-acetyltransferase
MLVYGRAAEPGEAMTLLTELPPGRLLDDKFVFELDGGVVDVVRGYREQDEWYLGLMLFAPEHRSTGRGARALEQLVQWLEPQGARHLRLAVAEQNVRALEFWKRHGFRFDRRFAPRALGVRETVLLEFVRDL